MMKFVQPLNSVNSSENSSIKSESDHEKSSEECNYEEAKLSEDESMKDDSSAEIEEEENDDSAAEVKGSDESNENESDVEDDLSGFFSKNIRDDSLELKKAAAVANQLKLWDNLIESRILIQKCIADSNEIPLEQISSQCSSERNNSIEQLQSYLTKLTEFQKKLRHQMTNQEEIEDDKYDNYRNSQIEDWYNRTKRARLNFSAFELPLLKHIESDKSKLVQKTYMKRSQSVENKNTSDEGNLTTLIDKETINDDDFYHKLLRHYIRRKTADISDSTQLGRQWIKLQNLRSKMKRKIDTRRTKGRKIKFDIYNKLVNFMAMQKSHSWEDDSVNELYSSVFDKF